MLLKLGGDVGHTVKYRYDLRDQVVEVAINDDAPIAIARDALGRRVFKHTGPIPLRVAVPDSAATWHPWPQWRGIACDAPRQCAGQAGSLSVSAAQIFLRHSRPAIVLASGH